MLSIKNILVPIDFSEHCTQALDHARELAAAHDSELHLLHIVERGAFPSFYRMGEEAMFGETSSLRERAREALSECVDTDGEALDESVKFHVEDGHPGERIVKFAEENDSDLIVIATHGLTGVERVLMGSVAQKIIRDSPCPVFVVKANGKSLVSKSSD